MYTRLTHCAALRRHPRHSARIPAHVESDVGEFDVVTGDVSLSGALLWGEEMHEAVEIDDRIDVWFWLPNSLERVRVTARVARKVEGARGFGVGVELDQAPGEAWSVHWEEFIERLAIQHSSMYPSVGERSARIDYTMRHLTLDDLDELLHVDVFIGGIFLETPADVEAGTRLRLMILHPIDGSRMHIAARVTRRLNGNRCGLCVEFEERGATLSQRIQEFVQAGMPQVVIEGLHGEPRAGLLSA